MKSLDCARIVTFLTIFLISLTNCSRYGLLVPEAEREVGSQSILVPENFQTARLKLNRWLRMRGRLDRSIQPSGESFKIYFLTPWVRDFSLRFYYLDLDSRTRHLSEWASQWTLKAIAKERSLLKVTVLELIYLGPANSSPKVPHFLSKNQLESALTVEWAETDPDKLRATMELRRYWNETYPLLPLPKQLANVNVPSLLAPPISKDWTKTKWHPVQRSRSF